MSDIFMLARGAILFSFVMVRATTTASMAASHTSPSPPIHPLTIRVRGRCMSHHSMVVDTPTSSFYETETTVAMLNISHGNFANFIRMYRLRPRYDHPALQILRASACTLPIPCFVSCPKALYTCCACDRPSTSSSARSTWPRWIPLSTRLSRRAPASPPAHTSSLSRAPTPSPEPC